jgi:hypothetical protein
MLDLIRPDHELLAGGLAEDRLDELTVDDVMIDGVVVDQLAVNTLVADELPVHACTPVHHRMPWIITPHIRKTPMSKDEPVPERTSPPNRALQAMNKYLRTISANVCHSGHAQAQMLKKC